MENLIVMTSVLGLGLQCFGDVSLKFEEFLIIFTTWIPLATTP